MLTDLAGLNQAQIAIRAQAAIIECLAEIQANAAPHASGQPEMEIGVAWITHFALACQVSLGPSARFASCSAFSVENSLWFTQVSGT